jgi:hypothetical protein
MIQKPIIILFAALMSFATTALGGELIEGTYIGWKPLEDLTPDVPGDSWFRVHRLTLKGKELTIEASPKIIEKGKVWSSSSDGGFLTYKGMIYEKEGVTRVKLRVVHSDYLGIPKGGWPELDHEIKELTKVSFIIDTVTYTLTED